MFRRVPCHGPPSRAQFWPCEKYRFRVWRPTRPSDIPVSDRTAETSERPVHSSANFPTYLKLPISKVPTSRRDFPTFQDWKRRRKNKKGGKSEKGSKNRCKRERLPKWTAEGCAREVSNPEKGRQQTEKVDAIIHGACLTERLQRRLLATARESSRPDVYDRPRAFFHVRNSLVLFHYVRIITPGALALFLDTPTVLGWCIAGTRRAFGAATGPAETDRLSLDKRVRKFHFSAARITPRLTGVFTPTVHIPSRILHLAINRSADGDANGFGRAVRTAGNNR